MIKYIAIVTSEGASVYAVGRNGVDKIEGGNKFIDGDPFLYYFVYDKDGKMIAEISGKLPLEIKHKPDL